MVSVKAGFSVRTQKGSDPVHAGQRPKHGPESTGSRPTDPTAGAFRILLRTGAPGQPATLSDAQVKWADELFRIYGFAPSEVRPTLQLMEFHQHHEDRAAWLAAVNDSALNGRPVSRWHRIVTATRKSRTLVTTFRPTVDQDRVVAVSGMSIDVTDQLRQDRADEVTRAVVRSAETRAVIDQAKGVLMATLDLDEERAFELLRWYSSYANVKVRHIASALVEGLADNQASELPPRQRITALITALSGSAPVFPDIAAEFTDNAPAESHRPGAAPRIAPALLPRTLVRAISEASVSIAIADCLTADYPLVYVNPAFERLTGYRAEEILGRNCRFLQNSETDRRQVDAMRRALDAGRDVRVTLRNVRRDGTGFWNDVHLSPVRDAEGRLTHYLGYQTDITERITRQQYLEQLAFSDATTGLPNEAATVRHLARRIEKSPPNEFFLTLLEIVGWPVSDPYDDNDDGRAQTEGLARLRKMAGDVAFLSRVGPETFAVVGVRPVDCAVVAEAFASPLDDHSPTLPVRVGVAAHPADGRDARALLGAAHRNLQPV